MILLGKEAKDKLLEGINLVADTVKPTLGPQARTIILQDNPPVIINDGVTITRYVHSDDPYVQMGVQLVQNLANQAQLNTGDGTTTACILGQALCQEIEKADIKNVHAFQKGFQKGLEIVLNELDAQTKPVINDAICQVATIAANNDAEIGRMIADVIEDVGIDAVISVEEGKTVETEYKVIDGMEIERGYMSNYFCNSDGGKCVLDNPLILMTTHHIMDWNDLLPYLEKALSDKRPLLIIAQDVTGQPMNNLLVNVMGKAISACCIKAPNFGDYQIEELMDIQSVVGGKVINAEAGDDLRKMSEKMVLGSATRVVIDNNKTTIMAQNSDKPKKRAEYVKSLLENEEDKFIASMLRKRIAKLLGGVAVISVGAGTEIEMREKKERLDDALNATQAAIQEGVVMGAGKALYNASFALSDKSRSQRILKAAIRAPMMAILNNSQMGAKATESILQTCEENKAIGFNAVTGETCDLMEAGIIDPTKVTKSSLTTAASIASLFLTTEGAVIREVVE